MTKRRLRKPTQSKKNNNVLITAFMVIAIFLGITVFLIFTNKPTETTSSKPIKTSGVVKKPNVKPVALPSAPVPTLVVKPTIQPKSKIPTGSGKIAFILDDWGQSMRNCKYLKEIDAPLAIAILPSLRNSDNIAQCARMYKKTILLHLPLQAYHNNDPYPTDYIIKTDMKPDKVEKILNDILLKMPYIEGVNNHMGSKATENENLMKLILRRVKNKGVFFVDSMTAPKHSVCAQIARDLKLPFAQRDIFLDNINTKEDIIKQIHRLATKAKLNGSAIAIGHDRDLTLQVIKEQIPLLRAQGFTIVSVKELVSVQ